MGAPTISGPVPTGGGTPIGGSGTAGTLAKFASSTTIGDSVLTEKAGAIVTVTAATPTATTGSYVNLTCTGGTGTGATLDVTVTAGVVSSVTVRAPGNNYTVGDTLTCAGLTGLSPAGATVATVATIVGEIETSANISTTGRIGVGNLDPGERLTVSATSGNDRIGLDVVGTLSTITFGSTNGTSGAIRTIANDRTSGLFSINYGTNPGPLSTALSINSTGQLLIGQQGTAAAPVLADATGVNGMYFPSSTTTAIVANGAVAATFSKVAGAGVALGGTTGLVFDASGTQQGVKLTATPGSTNVQTLDAYNENTSWSPTVTWGTGGTVTTTSATGAYTQIGNVVTFTVTIVYNSAVVPTGGSVTMDLPRPSATGFNQRPGTWAFNSWNGAAGTFFLSIGSNSSTATLRVANGTGTADVAANLTVTGVGALVVTATYLAS
jgi:hypothetical protein